MEGLVWTELVVEGHGKDTEVHALASNGRFAYCANGSLNRGLPANLVADYTNIRSYYLTNNDLLNHRQLPGFVLSQDTPFVLLEAGEDAPDGAQHDILWNQRDLVASGIAEGIIAYAPRL